MLLTGGLSIHVLADPTGNDRGSERFNPFTSGAYIYMYDLKCIGLSRYESSDPIHINL